MLQTPSNITSNSFQNFTWKEKDYEAGLDNYAYNDSGERVLKLTGPSTILDVNADIISYQSTLKNVTLYTSPYLVAHNKGYTKHFYAGSERVCAAIGEGGLNNLVPCIGNNQTLKNNANNLFHNTIGAMGDRFLLENDECLRNNKNTPKELLAEFENVAVNVKLSSGVDAGTFHNAINKYCSQDNANSAVYYYHSDHLGSASWITNGSGTPVQHLQYMPYGEPLVNERTTSYEERFTFTGKERDSETGYGYFGARYYDSDFLTGWLSVDPMADKYPSLSPYAYCAWNPVKLVDPDGAEIGDYYTLNGKFLKSDNIDDGKIYVVKPKNEMSVLGGNFNVEKYELPSYEARQQMCNYLELKDNENNLREYGGAIWENETTGSQEIRYAEPGPEWQGGNTDASVTTNNWEKDDGFNAVGKRILTYFHSHFSGSVKGDKLEQGPSGTDFNNVLSNGTLNRFGGARLPYNIVFGMGAREVSLYTEKGLQATIKFDVFRSIGGGK